MWDLMLGDSFQLTSLAVRNEAGQALRMGTKLKLRVSLWLDPLFCLNWKSNCLWRALNTRRKCVYCQVFTCEIFIYIIQFFSFVGAGVSEWEHKALLVCVCRPLLVGTLYCWSQSSLHLFTLLEILLSSSSRGQHVRIFILNRLTKQLSKF